MSSVIAIRVVVCCAILSGFGVSQDIPVPFERFSNPSRPDATAKAKVEALKHAVAVNPQSAETWIDLGWRLYKNGCYVESAAVHSTYCVA